MTLSAAELSSLLPAKVQKARVDDDRCVFEVFAGRKRFVVVVPGDVFVVDERSVDGRSAADEARTPPALQGLVRKELVPSILSAVHDDAARGLVRLTFARKDQRACVVVVETDARAPRWLVLLPTEDGERILSASPATRADDGRDLRRGRLYEPPRRAPQPRVTTSTTTTTTSVAPALPPRLADARARIKRELERLRRLDRALTGDAQKHGDAAVLEHDGELLKTVLGTLRRGMGSVVVADFVDGAARTIALDVAKDGRENLTALFARARKARTAAVRTAPRRAEIAARLLALEPLRAALGAVDVTDAAAVDDAIARVDTALASGATTQTAPSARRTAARAGRRQAWRAFAVPVDDAGSTIVVRVGRGAKDNDALVKAARGNDLWLHARDATGAHVVVPSHGGPVPDALLRDAALLAAHFSSLRGERHVDIQHTRVKHLKKPGPGAPAGLFLVGHETVLALRLDEARLATLLRAEVPAA